jgi:hypothetical protein
MAQDQPCQAPFGSGRLSRTVNHRLAPAVQPPYAITVSTRLISSYGDAGAT